MGKGTGENENPHHHHDVAVGGTTGEALDSLRKAARTADHKGPGAGSHESHGDGHLVEITHHDGGGEVKDEEDQQRAEDPQSTGVGADVEFSAFVLAHSF